MSAAFRCRIGDFDSSNAFEKLGFLIAASASAGFSTHHTKQTEAWLAELDFLRVFCDCLMAWFPLSRDWFLLFEFDIPRRGKRPDLVLLAGDIIFVLEFKINAEVFSSDDRWQVFSYGLDLRDFHLGSPQRMIVPVLIATGAGPQVFAAECAKNPDAVLAVQCAADPRGEATAGLVRLLYEKWHNPNASGINAKDWERAPYRPTPTIIQAAEQLFAGHSVANISHAFASNLDVTCAALLQAIERAQLKGERMICFVTGIPGAGKTLAGLNAVHDPGMRGQGRPAAVFLSGNGPLVRIVRSALVRDRRAAGVNAKDAARIVATFIDNVHRFIKTYGLERLTEAPYENAVIFDEAQRAWSADAVYSLHKIRKSEPDLILDIMERAQDWSAIIALVGGGQEINKGEAGLEEWGRALNGRTAPWRVLASPDVLAGSEAVSGHRLFVEKVAPMLQVVPTPELHLRESVRSPRARRIADWVNSLVTGSSKAAVIEAIDADAFPIVLTRDLEAARRWLRVRSEGVQRCGLLASSGALRLRAHGLEVSTGFRHGFPYEEWFLAGADDPRSSISLEVAATEFECQGLELDWTGVCWGGDFVRSQKEDSWLCRKFRGRRWQKVHVGSQTRYLQNKYRVLLTRARRGMVIWVPAGDPNDPTREPELFDAIATYLQGLGLPVIS